MEDLTIPRQTVRVMATLIDSRKLEGEIQIDPGMRLSDFINRPEQFLVLRDKNGALRIVNKNQIIEIMEL